MGIDLNINIIDSGRSVRQSSRLAQIKIKEQVDSKIAEESNHKSEKSHKKSTKKKVCIVYAIKILSIIIITVNICGPVIFWLK